MATQPLGRHLRRLKPEHAAYIHQRTGIQHGMIFDADGRPNQCLLYESSIYQEVEKTEHGKHRKIKRLTE